MEYGASCAISGTAPVQTNHPSGVYLWKLANNARLDPGQYCQLGRIKLIMQTNGKPAGTGGLPPPPPAKVKMVS